MKLIIYITLLFIFSIFAQRSYAVSDATGSATPTGTDKQVQDLKDRLATKVAQLSQSQRYAIAGTVKSTSITSFTVETSTKEVKIELNDNLTVFQNLKGKRTKLTTDDIAKGDSVVVFGLYDATLDILKAKVVFIDGNQEIRTTGTISEINKDDYTLTVKGSGEISTIIDIEKTTRAFNWVIGKGIEKGGFSKLSVGSRITITGTIVPKTTNRISASRLIQLVSASDLPTPTVFVASESASAKPTVQPTTP